jgi:hypothetical protein
VTGLAVGRVKLKTSLVSKEKVTSGEAKQRYQDFEDRHCAPVGNWVSPPTNKQDNQLRKCLYGPARDCVKMILLTNDVERAVKILQRNYGNSEIIFEQLMNDVNWSKDVTNSKSFQGFSYMVENEVEISHTTGKELVKLLLMKLPKYLRIQWGSYMLQHNVDRQNIDNFANWIASLDKIVSAVEIGSHNPQHRVKRIVI